MTMKIIQKYTLINKLQINDKWVTNLIWNLYFKAKLENG